MNAGFTTDDPFRNGRAEDKAAESHAGNLSRTWGGDTVSSGTPLFHSYGLDWMGYSLWNGRGPCCPTENSKNSRSVPGRRVLLLRPIQHTGLSCFSFIDDDGEPVILRFQSYHSYFLKKWIGVGLIAVILTAVQTGAILLSGIGLPLGNEWNLAAGATEAELFSTLEQLFASPLQAFVCFTLYQLIGSWLIFGICMWIGHFAGRKWTIRIVIVLYVLSAVWIKLPAIQNIPLTSFNHLLILHHNLVVPHRFEITACTLLLLVLIIAISIRFAWRGQLPHILRKSMCRGYSPAPA